MNAWTPGPPELEDELEDELLELLELPEGGSPPQADNNNRKTEWDKNKRRRCAVLLPFPSAPLRTNEMFMPITPGIIVLVTKINSGSQLDRIYPCAA